MSSRTIRVFEEGGSLYRKAAEAWLEGVLAAISMRGKARVALSGGETPRSLYRLLASGERSAPIPWNQVDIYFADERCVPAEHPASNYRLVVEELISQNTGLAGRLFRIPVEEGGLVAALHYAALLGEEPLDLAVLGMGEDGHTASLFPDTPSLTDPEQRVVATRSPTWPHDRVSLSLKTLNQSRVILMLVTGTRKAESVREVFAQIQNGQPRCPASLIDPLSGELHWYLDRKAAALLPTSLQRTQEDKEKCGHEQEQVGHRDHRNGGHGP